MRKLLLLVAGIAIFSAAVGCRKAGAAAVKGDLLYVDEVVAPDRARAGQEVVVTIHGNKPDPSWNWLRNEVTVEDATVTIDVLGERTKTGAVAMVLVPFTTTATLSGLPTGRLDLVVRGRQRTFSKPLEIVP
ncbi:MAG: hypothetical protein FJZ01_11670 [Candidatus Sericytochromatia bacterium]|nr:hypothetical protein [Candidatus Tanganyikabacteria bacterium]